MRRYSKHSGETREKMSIAHWKGENAGYVAKHSWNVKILGQPTQCNYCDQDGLKGKKIHWANKSGNYKRQASDWIRLCASCHKIYDMNIEMREMMLDYL